MKVIVSEMVAKALEIDAAVLRWMIINNDPMFDGVAYASHGPSSKGDNYNYYFIEPKLRELLSPRQEQTLDRLINEKLKRIEGESDAENH